MAGMTEVVFGYDGETVYEELSEFPSLTFYDNGIVEAGWSHNQGLAGRFWPYEVYRWDREKDVYRHFGGVDAWDRSLREENYDGEPFPADADADGDGFVYYILPDGWNGQYDMPAVDGQDYENWRSAYLDGAKEVEILRSGLTEENIAALGCPRPDIQPAQPKG